MKINKDVLNKCKSLQALADPSRLSVLLILSEKNAYAGELKEKLKIEPTLLSHHLSILKQRGLVKATRVGKRVLYEISPSAKVKGKNIGFKMDGLKVILTD